MAKKIAFQITGYDQSEAAFRSFNNSVSKSESKIASFRNKTNLLANQAKVAFAAVASSVVGVGVASVKMSMDFNKAMADVDTLLSDQGRTKELKRQVQELSRETGKSTEELAGLSYDVISAFGDTPDTIEKVELAAKTAVAGIGSFDDAIGLISATTKAYGDTTLEAQQKVADLGQMTIKYGQTDLADLGTSVQRVTSLSKNLNVSQEELFASFSSTTGVLGNASEVSTQLGSTLKTLLSPPAELAKIFDNLGIESGKALIQQRGLQGALQFVREQADKTGVPLQKLVGRAEAMKFILSVTGAQAKKFSEDLDAMKDSAGTMDEAYKKQISGLNELEYKLSRVKATFVTVAQGIGDRLSPGLIGLSNDFLNLTDDTDLLDQKISNFIDMAITGFEGIGVGVEIFVRVMRGAKLYISTLETGIANFASFSIGTFSQISDFFYQNVTAPMIEFLRILENIPYVGEKVSKALDFADEIYSSTNDTVKAYSKFFDDYAEASTKNWKEEIKALQSDIEEGFESSKIAEKFRKGLEQFDKELEKQKTKKREIPVDVKPELKPPSDESMEKYKKSTENLLNQVTSMKKDADSEQDESTEKSADSMKSSFSDVVTDWKTSLDSMVRSSDISFSSIGKSFLNHVTKKFSTKMFDAGIDAIGSFLFPGFATGGYFDGGFRIVGENGPELEATGPARIYNSQETKQILSGGNSDSSINVVQNFDFSGAGQNVEERVMRLVPMIKDQTIAAWAEMKVRGEL